MIAWHVNPEKHTIQVREIPEIAEAGVQEYVFISPAPLWKRFLLRQHEEKHVVPILFASQPEIFSVPLEETFIRSLAKALMVPPARPSAGGLFWIVFSLITGGVVGYMLHMI